MCRLDVIFVDERELRKLCDQDPVTYPEKRCRDSLAQMIEDVRRTYADRNVQWFEGALGPTRAFICFYDDGTFTYEGRDYQRDDGYVPSTGEYVFTTDTGRLLAYNREHLEQTLEHEMLHAYQGMIEVTEAGRSAYAAVRQQGCYQVMDPGPGHDEQWFTAICVVADRLGISWQRLFKRVRQ